MTIKGRDIVATAIAGTMALIFAAAPSVAQSRKPAAAPTSKPVAAAEKQAHRLILQVITNEAGMMNLALNNAQNVAQYYQDLGETVEIEVVTFGPGLHMLRDDTSPVKARIKAIAASTPSIAFKACGNTQANMGKAESKEIALIPEASVVKSGVVRVMELQEKGWTYVRP